MSRVYNFLKATKGAVIPPVVTWLDSNGSVDLDAMTAHADWLLRNGASGIFVLGSTGEFPYLTFDQKRRIIEGMVSHVGPDIPVIAGISSMSLENAMRLGKVAIELGASGLMAIVPEFFPLKPGDVERYYRALSMGINGNSGKDTPLILYYMPLVSSFKLEPRLIFQLAKEKVIHGIKYTGFKTEYMKELKDMLDKDYTVQCNTFVGTDACLLDCLKGGIAIDGAIMGSLNLFPGFYKALLQSYTEKPRNEAKCNALAKTVPIIVELFSMELRELPVLVKETLRLGNLPFAKNTAVSQPLPSMSTRTKDKIVQALDKLKTKGIEL
ncbi:hypothetical protein GF325_13480 [Candidatus Bathyarchaeota archaeon]|nr:hypothetical protein [Candidatus Bathyarchaeota archaeon]